MAVRPTPPAGTPAGLSRFCGRQRELAQLREMLATDRLVTVTGTGGIGKTRLVMELARAAAFDFPDGVWVVELARIESNELVATGIAEAIAAPADGRATPLERARGLLRRGRHLLILDNCEHVLEGAAGTAWDLLTECAGLTVVATSREALNVRGERVWPLRPLRLPESPTPGDESHALSEAVELFCDRAHLSNPGETPAAQVEADVAEICRRLDGIPLALELAAAWVPVLSLTEIAQRLDDSLAALEREAVGRPSRHHSLRACLDWSWRLLTAAQQDAFARLSVFVGGFALDGARAVLGNDGRADDPSLELVASLVARSLLSAETAGDHARYRFLEPVRQYAAEQLESRGDEAQETRRRHLAFLADLGERAEEPLAGGPDLPWMRRLDEELGNIRVALDWGFAHDRDVAARLTAALLIYCTHRGLYEEGTGWALQAAQTSTSRTRVRALLMAGWYAAERGDVDTQAAHLATAYELACADGWSYETVMVLHAQSLAAYVRGDLDAMWTLGQEGLEVARRSGNAADMMWAAWSPAVCLAVRGENQAALELFTEAVEIATRLDNHFWRASLVCNVIDTAIDLGDLATAARHLHSALTTGDTSLAVYHVEAAAILAIQRGDNDLGLRLLGAGRSMLARSGYRETPDEAKRRQLWISIARDGMASGDADTAWAAGLAMSLQAATEQAKGVVNPDPDARGGAPAVAAIANAFTREGQYWSLAYAGVVTRVRDSKGMRDLARLLAAQGRGVAAIDLCAADQGGARGNERSAEDRGDLHAEADTGEVLDAAARAQYRARLIELDGDITEADTANDPERASRARIERDFLVSELRAAVGLGGRPRRGQDPAERARKAVTWRVRESINQIAGGHPALGHHLRRSVRTGSICAYEPDQPTEWRLEPVSDQVRSR
jgi:predicted ATPase